jgi:hypothetical protein
MRVEVKFHHRTRVGLYLWRETLGTTEAERDERYGTFIDAMTDEFRKNHGFPPDAPARSTPDGLICRWQYTSTLLIEFSVSERPRHPRGWWDVIGFIRRWLGQVVRTVLVTRVVEPAPRSV